jgi:hypothetical protein
MWELGCSASTRMYRCQTLVIFASTVSRCIAEVDPRGRLDLILRQRSTKSWTGLTGTYLQILSQVFAFEDSDQCDNLIHDFKRIVGALVLLYDPLSISALVHLTRTRSRKLTGVLCTLRSVLNIPQAADSNIDLTKPVTLFHLSFRDFLMDSTSKNENTLNPYLLGLPT